MMVCAVLEIVGSGGARDFARFGIVHAACFRQLGDQSRAAEGMERQGGEKRG